MPEHPGSFRRAHPMTTTVEIPGDATIAGLCSGCAPPLTLTGPDGSPVDLGPLISILAASPGQLWPPLTLTVAGLPLLHTCWTVAPGPRPYGLLCAVARVLAPPVPFHSPESSLWVQVRALPGLRADDDVLGAAFAREAAEATLLAGPAPDVASLLPHLWAGMRLRLHAQAHHHQRQVQILQRLLDLHPAPTATPGEPTL